MGGDLDVLEGSCCRVRSFFVNLKLDLKSNLHMINELSELNSCNVNSERLSTRYLRTVETHFACLCSCSSRLRTEHYLF